MDNALRQDLYACLEIPTPRGWRALQARWVDRIKRAAIRRLHASPRGARFLLRVYLAVEEETERALLDEHLTASPEWLARQARQHLAEERRHVQAFADALRAAGGQSRRARGPGWLGRGKIEQWRALARASAMKFKHGVLVPAYATGLCAEQMGERVLRRHCEVIGAAHPLYPLLSGVLADEGRHVRVCASILRRIVASDEVQSLATLLTAIRRIESAWGITGSLAMYCAGSYYALRHRLRRHS